MIPAYVEAYVKECIEKRKCPACGHKIHSSCDALTGDKMVVCGCCGYTALL